MSRSTRRRSATSSSASRPSDEGVSLSRHLEVEADIEEFREFVVHRSLYQLKEADPHSWAIPRLTGAAKTALLEVQADEYGGGRPERMHSRLFAKTMRALGLDDRENAYLDHVPGVTLATVNLMSATRPAAQPARRDRRPPGDVRDDLRPAQPPLRQRAAAPRASARRRPTSTTSTSRPTRCTRTSPPTTSPAAWRARSRSWPSDILFGARALLYLEDRFARHLLEAWEDGRTSLRRPLPDVEG